MYIKYVTETQNYTEGYTFNRIVSKDGTAVDRWGTATRDIERVTYEIKGDKADVEAQAEALSPSTRKNPTTVTKQDGPWWMARVSVVEYGDWEYTYSDDESSSGD